MGAIDKSEWRWRGMPGHFCNAARCCFHLVTQVGRYSVSSIGCYHPDGEASDETRADIGSGRKFETMVFDLQADGYAARWTELSMLSAQAPEECERNHVAECERVASEVMQSRPAFVGYRLDDEDDGA